MRSCKLSRRGALMAMAALPVTMTSDFWSAGTAEAGLLAAPSTTSTTGGPVEPEAGAWPTWLLASSSQVPVPAPPDSTAEVGQVGAMSAQRDPTMLDRIAYWDAGPAPYRWSEIAIELAYLKNGLPGPRASRIAALMDAAMYDALVVAWGAKYAHNRPRPSDVDPAIEPAVAVSPTPSYPCEHATAAGAASVVLAHLFPPEATALTALAEEAGRSRVVAGVQYLSDVAAGLELGRAVGAMAVERARTDNFDAKGTWTIPTEPGKWTGPAAVFADDALWKPWLLSSGSDLRPPPPPAFDSPEMAAELAEVRDFQRTPRTSGLALGWQYGTFGGPNAEVQWLRQASRRMFEERWDVNAPRAAQVYLLMTAAFVDTWIATQDAKFHYWGIKPNQLDPSLTTVFPTPPHPSYPSNRASLYTAMATVLAHYFPRDAQEFRETAHQISESALWAGIHFRSDLTAAQAIGSEVARLALARVGSGAGSG